MAATELDRLTWPEVREQVQAGRDTVVMALGATEQHGRHMPLATDALLGDHLARLVADRLDAFLAPTLRIGCSAHHVGFAGTMSLSEETFHAIVADVVGSLASGGFRRIVLIPTHGGTFGPLPAAVEKLGGGEGGRGVALGARGGERGIEQVGGGEICGALGDGGVAPGVLRSSL